MGILSVFSHPAPAVLRLPAGSFTVDRSGEVLTSTLPSSFPAALVHAIGREVLRTFHEAASAQLPLAELVVDYPSLKITARELRGGALVFLRPEVAASTALPE